MLRRREDILRLLLWGSFVRKDGRAPLAADEIRDDAPPLLQTLENKGLLSSMEREHIELLERAFLQNYDGDIDRAIEALGGEVAAQRFIAPPEPITAGDPSTAPMVGSPRFTRSTEVDIVESPGRYTHISEHATGGMGRVLLVHDRQMGREVAFKELLPESEHEGETEDSPARRTTAMATRFLQEGLLTAKLEHPSIVPVYEVGRRENGTLYYTMKLVRGKTFSARIKDCKTLEDRLALVPNYVQLCQAIAYAHSRNVIHRDIKPANVMIGDFGETVVLDWGIAKVRDSSDEEEQATIQRFREKLIEEHGPEIATQIGQAIGTPGYMSPEQALGFVDKIAETSDIFSLGVVLYEILSGQRPFDAGSVPSLLNQTVREDPKPLQKIDPLIPPELASICVRAMQKDPRERYPSVEAMLNDIINFQTGALVSSHEYSPREVLLRYYRRNRPWILSGATAAAGLLVAFLFSYYSVWQARDLEREQRIRAESAEQEAEANLVVAEEQRAEAIAQRERAEEESWIASLRLMHRALHDGDFATVRALLPKIPEERRGWEWRHATYASQRETLVLSQPGEPPHALEFNTARTRALVLYDYRRARVWDILGRKVLYESEPMPDRLNTGTLLDDGVNVALGYAHGIVTVRAVGSGAELARTRLTDGQPCSALEAMNNDELIIGTEDGRVLRWAWRAGQEPALVAQLPGRVDALNLSPINQLIAAWHGDNQIVVLPLNAPAFLPAFPGQMTGFSPDGSLFASVHAGRCEVRNALDGSIAWATDQEVGEISFAKADPRGNIVARAAGDVAIVFDINTGKRIYMLGDESIRDAAVSTDGRYFITVDNRGFVAWTDMATKAIIDRAGGHEGDMRGLIALEEGNAATLDNTGNVRFWSPERAIQTAGQWLLDSPGGPIQKLLGSSTDLLAASRSNSEVWLMNTANGRTVGSLSAQSLGSPRNLAFSANGAMLAYVVDGFSVATVPSDLSAAPIVYRGTSGFLGGMAISSDGTLLAAGDNHGRVTVWNVGNPEPLAQVQCGEDYLPAQSFLPDNSLVLGSSTGAVYHVATNPPSLLRTIEGEGNGVTSLAVSSSTKLFALGYTNGTIALLYADTLEQVSTVKAASGMLEQLRFTESGDRLFSISEEVVSLWLITENNSLENSGLDWQLAGITFSLAGPQEDLWTGGYSKPLTVHRTQAPDPQAQAASLPYVQAALSTPERLADIAARLDSVAPDWRAQISSGTSIPEGALAETVTDLGWHAGMTLNRGADLDAVLNLLTTEAPCGEVRWSGGIRSGQSFTGLVSVVCPETPEYRIDLGEDEVRQLQEQFVTALQFYGTGLQTQLQMRTEDWLDWPPAEGTHHLWLPDMSVSPLKPWLTKLRLSVYDRIAAIDTRSFNNVKELIEYLRQYPVDGEAPGNTVRLDIKRGAFSNPVVLLE